MSNNYFTNPLVFLIETAFFLYMILLALRLLMPWARWDYHHPISQFIVRFTQPPLNLLRSFIPAIGRLDTATLVLLIIVTMIKLLLVSMLFGYLLGPMALIQRSIAEIFSLFITLFTVTILIEVVLSWITPPGSHNPAANLIRRLNAPLLEPVRKKMPSTSGLDLTPLVVVIGLQLLHMLVLPLLLLGL
ncbi:Integral membrane protein YggT [Methylophaga lonarensis MPL]|uniref:Integral membrane protein YggT n=1 Tax=Methylophaga lonarensis MPL TaxID=1286106 RepID=M7P0Z2_9GAMM|nr:YggT family protein [Methylophaga lonarensis]EMR13147.1 Integral membrane protein YggT [Methylophaga lonarensis MPL]